VGTEFLRNGVCASVRARFSAAIHLYLVVFGLALSLSGSAEAHHQHRGSDTSGISIPNLTHGQLRVMTRYLPVVLDLANRQVRPGIEARTLQNFVNLQFAYCLWGLVPGSLSEEDNPFNACSHAYLAGSKALLDRLRQTEETRIRADVLAEEINLALVQDASALEICGNGIDPFNTAQIIMPELADVSFNPLGVLLGIIVFGAAAGAFATGRTGRRAAAH
jgi:hypothetical protein